MTDQNRSDILNVRIRHEAYERAFSDVSEALQIAKAQPGTVLPILGPTRCGKTDLLLDLQKTLDVKTIGPGRLVPSSTFGFASIPPKPNDRDLYRTMLEAIGYTCGPREKTSHVRDRLITAIEEEGVEVIALDECNHCAETGSNLSPRATGDHFKRIIDETGVTLILAGLPKFQKIIDENEQFRERSLSTILFLPYSWNVEADRNAFGEAFFSILSIVENAGLSYSFDDLEMAVRLYGVTGGRVGQVLRIFKGAVTTSTGPEISFQDVEKSAKRLTQRIANPGLFFETEPPTDLQLTRAYAAVMKDADLSIEPRNLAELDALNQM